MPVVIFSGIPRFWKKLLFSDSLDVYRESGIQGQKRLSCYDAINIRNTLVISGPILFQEDPGAIF